MSYKCYLLLQQITMQLPDCMSHLTNCNFIVRMLFCDSYWLYSLYSSSCIFIGICLQLRLDNVLVMKHLIWLSMDSNNIHMQRWEFLFKTIAALVAVVLDLIYNTIQYYIRLIDVVWTQLIKNKSIRMFVQLSDNNCVIELWILVD